jgi:hypothetical protein
MNICLEVDRGPLGSVHVITLALCRQDVKMAWLPGFI